MVEGGIAVGHYLVVSLKQQRKLKTTMTKRIGKKIKYIRNMRTHFLTQGYKKPAEIYELLQNSVMDAPAIRSCSSREI